MIFTVFLHCLISSLHRDCVKFFSFLSDSMIYWERAKKPKTEATPFFIPWAPSAETEKTCYVLLALISQKMPNLTYASKVVQWLAQQMNSHGGFSSTQVIGVSLTLRTIYLMQKAVLYDNLDSRGNYRKHFLR